MGCDSVLLATVLLACDEYPESLAASRRGCLCMCGRVLDGWRWWPASLRVFGTTALPSLSTSSTYGAGGGAGGDISNATRRGGIFWGFD